MAWHHTAQLMSLIRRAIVVPLILGAILLGLVTSGCSHTQPYMRHSVLQPEPPGQLQQRVLFFGDGGEPQCHADQQVSESTLPCDATLRVLVSRASKAPQHTTILFLGDNIYPAGLPDIQKYDEYLQAQQRLDVQIVAVKHSNAEGIFIPGNHDWQKGKPHGLQAMQRQEAYVNSRPFGARVSFLPMGGCPGPAVIERNGIRIVVLDTQWWLHDYEKCLCITPTMSLEQLREAISSAQERDVVVVAHHPLQSYGPHGGFFDWQDHLFPLTAYHGDLWLPLPLIGSLYPLLRPAIHNPQDLSSTQNRDMVQQFTTILRTKKPLIYASGHEHSLQVLEGHDVAHYLLVSGAGSKTSKVHYGPETLFAHEHYGFMEVDFFLDGSVLLRVIEPRGGMPEGDVVFSQWLRAR